MFDDTNTNPIKKKTTKNRLLCKCYEREKKKNKKNQTLETDNAPFSAFSFDRMHCEPWPACLYSLFWPCLQTPTQKLGFHFIDDVPYYFIRNLLIVNFV